MVCIYVWCGVMCVYACLVDVRSVCVCVCVHYGVWHSVASMSSGFALGGKGNMCV